MHLQLFIYIFFERRRAITLREAPCLFIIFLIQLHCVYIVGVSHTNIRKTTKKSSSVHYYYYSSMKFYIYCIFNSLCFSIILLLVRRITFECVCIALSGCLPRCSKNIIIECAMAKEWRLNERCTTTDKELRGLKRCFNFRSKCISFTHKIFYK